MAKKVNGAARWIVVAFAIGGLIFNSGILYNDVRHLKDELMEIKQEVKEIRNHLMK